MFAAVFLLTRCDIGRPEKYVVPKGYVGDVCILPGYARGVPPEREGLARVFRIPPNGILVTQDSPSKGWHSMKYYEVDAAGNRDELVYEPSSIPTTPANLRDQRRIAWRATGIGGITATDLPCDVRFTEFYVGTPAHLLTRTPEQAYEKEQQVQDLVRRTRLCP
jgi:hypothetical protein